MNVTKIKDKILKLLRLAQGREDEPEGQTALETAQRLMDEHGITVEPEDIQEDQGPSMAEQWIVEAPEPIAWIEMLLVALCDIIYGGVVLPMKGPAGWRLYVVSEEGEVDIGLLSAHFSFLKEQVQILAEDFADVLEAQGQYTDHRFDSFCLGMVYGITEILFEEIEGFEPEAQDMPFTDLYDQKALVAPEQDEEEHPQDVEEEHAIAPHVDSFKKQVEANNAVFQRICPPSHEPEPPEDVVDIRPDWGYFEHGRQVAHHHIDEVFLPDEAFEPQRDWGI